MPPNNTATVVTIITNQPAIILPITVFTHINPNHHAKKISPQLPTAVIHLRPIKNLPPMSCQFWNLRGSMTCGRDGAGILSISANKAGHRRNQERFRSIYAPNPEDASSTPTSEETELYSSPAGQVSESTQTEANALAPFSARWRKRRIT